MSIYLDQSGNLNTNVDIAVAAFESIVYLKPNFNYSGVCLNPDLIVMILIVLINLCRAWLIKLLLERNLLYQLL